MRVRTVIRKVLLLFGLILIMSTARSEEAKAKPTFNELVRQSNVEARQALAHHLLYHAKPEIKFGYKDDTGKITEVSVRHVLVTSSFRDGGRTVVRRTVTDKGENKNVVDIYNHAEQDTRSGNLSKQELTRLNEVMSTLPVAEIDPPIDSTVYISFVRDGKWCSYAYDARSLPERLAHVHVLLDENSGTERRFLR